MVRVILSGLMFALFSSSAAQPRNIHDVDFKNFAYPWDEESLNAVPGTWRWLPHLPQSRITLTQGQREFPPPGVKEPRGPYDLYPFVVLRSVTYGDLDSDGRDDAAVDLIYVAGGTANWHYLYIFTLGDGSPKLMALLESGSRAYGGLIGVSIQAGSLILDFMDSERRQGDCCSDGYIRVHYLWQRGRFIEQGSRSYDNAN